MCTQYQIQGRGGAGEKQEGEGGGEGQQSTARQKTPIGCILSLAATQKLGSEIVRERSMKETDLLSLHRIAPRMRKTLLLGQP